MTGRVCVARRHVSLPGPRVLGPWACTCSEFGKRGDLGFRVEDTYAWERERERERGVEVQVSYKYNWTTSTVRIVLKLGARHAREPQWSGTKKCGKSTFIQNEVITWTSK